MPDLKRVEQFVGMLGSDHDGERVNAARFLHKMAVEESKTMVEFFRSAFGGGGERIVYRDRIVEKTVYRDPPTQPSSSLHRAAQNRAEHQTASKAYGYKSMEGKFSTLMAYHWDKLTDFEKEFINSVRPKVADGLDLTPKQRKVLAEIFNKAGMS